MHTLITALTLAASPVWLGTPPDRIDRIVSLAPSVTETLFELGVGHKIVGITRFDDFPAATAKLAKVGGFNDPDPEAVLTLNPDLIVAVPTSGGRQRLETIARLGTPVLVLPAASIDDVWATVEFLGNLLERPGAAQQLSDKLRSSLAQVERRYSPRPSKRVIVIVGRRPLIAAGPATYFDALLPTVGAANVVSRGGAYPQLDLEALAALDPDVIIDVSMGETSGDTFWAGAAAVPAVRAGRVVILQDDTLLRLGPRLPTGLARLGAAIHGHR